MRLSALRRRLAARVLPPAVLLALALGAAAPAQADPTGLGLAYRLSIGGLLVAKATMTISLTEDGYEIRTDASTTGAVEWFVEADYAAAATGERGGAPFARVAVTPTRMTVDTLSGGDAQDVTMTFSGGAPDAVVADPPFDPRPWQIEPRAQRGALDPLSAAVAALLAGDDICTRTFPIFDGRRRYDVILEGVVREREVDGAPAIDCRARFRRVAGFKPRFMSEPDYTFEVRFQRRPDGLMLPVRAWGRTEFGGAVAVLR